MSETNDSAPLLEYQTVCGGALKDPTMYPGAIHRGARVYFCTQACLRVFEQNPDAFMAGGVEHPLEDD